VSWRIAGRRSNGRITGPQTYFLPAQKGRKNDGERLDRVAARLD
jgi:hypothetical protein